MVRQVEKREGRIRLLGRENDRVNGYRPLNWLFSRVLVI